MHSYLMMRGGTEQEVGDSWPEIECFRCGVCCTRYRPKVTPREIDRIAQKLGMLADAFFSKYIKTVPTKDAYILQTSGDACPFLGWSDDGNQSTCSIYPFRPRACRRWVASLSRSECLEGLTKLEARGKLLLPRDLYPTVKAVRGLSGAVQSYEER